MQHVTILYVVSTIYSRGLTNCQLSGGQLQNNIYHFIQLFSGIVKNIIKKCTKYILSSVDFVLHNATLFVMDSCTSNGLQTLDPWPQLTTDEVDFQFENNFTTDQRLFQPLPDKEEYLQRLEHKLKRLKNSSQSDITKRRQIVDQLCEARKSCLEHLVDSDNIVFENEHTVTQPSGLFTWINPEQPLSTSETQRLIEQVTQDE